MGDTHFRSNIKGQAGTETITNFATITGTTVSGTTISGTTVSGTSITGTTVTTGNARVNTSGIKLGANLCIIFGTAVTAATLEAAATACLGTSVVGPGCLYLSSAAGAGLYTRKTNAASWSKVA